MNRKNVQNLLKLAPLELLVTAIVFLLSLFTFSFIVHEAVYGQEDVFDNKVIHFFSIHATPGLVNTMQKITFLGSTTFLLPAYLALIAWLLVRKKTQHAIETAVIALSSTGMMFALKEFFHRERPQMPIIKDIGGYSFPSGHSLSSFIFCSILIYLVQKSNLPSLGKCLLIIFLLLLALTIGLSRIVLNVHYATDVIGGFCLGIIWVILSFAIFKKMRRNKAVVNDELHS